MWRGWPVPCGARVVAGCSRCGPARSAVPGGAYAVAFRCEGAVRGAKGTAQASGVDPAMGHRIGGRRGRGAVRERGPVSGRPPLSSSSAEGCTRSIYRGPRGVSTQAVFSELAHPRGAHAHRATAAGHRPDLGPPPCPDELARRGRAPAGVRSAPLHPLHSRGGAGHRRTSAYSGGSAGASGAALRRVRAADAEEGERRGCAARQSDRCVAGSTSSPGSRAVRRDRAGRAVRVHLPRALPARLAAACSYSAARGCAGWPHRGRTAGCGGDLPPVATPRSCSRPGWRLPRGSGAARAAVPLGQRARARCCEVEVRTVRHRRRRVEEQAPRGRGGWLADPAELFARTARRAFCVRTRSGGTSWRGAVAAVWCGASPWRCWSRSGRARWPALLRLTEEQRGLSLLLDPGGTSAGSAPRRMYAVVAEGGRSVEVYPCADAVGVITAPDRAAVLSGHAASRGVPAGRGSRGSWQASAPLPALQQRRGRGYARRGGRRGDPVWSGGRIERIELREQRRRARARARRCCGMYVGGELIESVWLRNRPAGCSRVTSSSHSTRARASCGSSALPAPAPRAFLRFSEPGGPVRAARRLPARYLEVATTSTSRWWAGDPAERRRVRERIGRAAARPLGCRWCGDEVVRQDEAGVPPRPARAAGSAGVPAQASAGSRRAAGDDRSQGPGGGCAAVRLGCARIRRREGWCRGAGGRLCKAGGGGVRAPARVWGQESEGARLRDAMRSSLRCGVSRQCRAGAAGGHPGRSAGRGYGPRPPPTPEGGARALQLAQARDSPDQRARG